MNISGYRNFDLLITRAGDQYRAFVVDAPSGEASVFFDLPFAPHEVARLGGLTQGVRRHLGAAAEPGVAANLADLGSRLFAAIFRDRVRSLLAASLSSVSQEEEGLRLRLRFEEDAADLALLPWEILYNPDQNYFISLSEASPILRYLALPRSRSALLVEPPLRMLAVLSSPAALAPLDTTREWQAIQDALAALVGDGKFVLERLAKPTLEALQQRLLGEPVHILHFVGHGVFDEASQAGGLALEDAHGRPHLVLGKDLAKLLRNHPAVRLAYLNACEGALASGQSAFAGVAQALVQGGVPAAVAMQAEISDASAIALARTFYTALAAGRPVDAALTQARVALSAAGSTEWAIPVLFSRSPDNRLFDIRQVLPTPDCPYPGMAPFSEAQQAFFFGRDREIEDAVARLRQHPFLAVVGPSGSGKSSLIYAGVIPVLRKTRRFGAGEYVIKTMRPSDSHTVDGKAAPRQAFAHLLGCPPDALTVQTFGQPTLLLIDQFEELFTLAEAEEAQSFLDTLAGLMGQSNLYILITVRADFYPELMACSLWQPIRANRLELTPLGDDELWAAVVEPAGRVGVTVDEALTVKLIADAAGERGVLPLVQETLVLLWEKVKDRQLQLAAYRSIAEGNRSGLQVGIDRRASTVYTNLSPDAQAIARRIFLRLVQFGEGRADTRRQQTVAELRARDDVRALFDRTLARLVESRLLTASGEEGDVDRRIDIAHEALIAGWPRLQEWLGQRRVAEQTRRRLEAKAAEWVRAEKRGGLLDAYELQEAENWLAGEDALELGHSQDLADLVAASKAAIAQATAEKEAQRQRELEQAQKLAEEQRLRAEEAKRAANSLRVRLVAVTVAVVVALVAFGAATVLAKRAQDSANAAATAAVEAGLQRNAAFTASTSEARQKAIAEAASTLAVNERNNAQAEATRALAAEAIAEAGRQEAEREARRALARDLAGRSQIVLDRDPELGLLLAREAAKIALETDGNFTRETEESLYTALSSPYRGRSGQRPDATHKPVPFDPEALSEFWDKTGLPRELEYLDMRGYSMFLSVNPITTISFNADRSLAVTVECPTWALRENKLYCPNYAARLRSVATGEMLANLGSQADSVRFASFSGNGATIVTISESGRLQVWDSHGTRQADIGGVMTDVVAAEVSTDGSQVITQSGDGIARVWQLRDESRPVIKTEVPNFAVEYADSGRELVAVRTFRPWPLGWRTDGTELGAFDPFRRFEISSLTSAPDRRRVLGVYLGIDPVLWESDGTVKEIEGPWSNSAIRWASISHDGTRMVVGSDQGAIGVGDLANKQWLVPWAPTHQGSVRTAAFSPDDQLIVSAGADGAIGIRDATDGKVVRMIAGAHAGQVSAAWFAADGSRIVSAGEDGAAKVWDAATGELLLVLEDHREAVNWVQVGPAGVQAATASTDGNVRLWDVINGALLAEFQACDACSASYVAFSPDGNWLATTGEDSTIRQWRIWGSSAAALAEADHRVGRDFTDAERRQYGLD